MPVCTEDLDKAIVEVTGTFDGVEEISAELREGIVNYTVKPVLSGHPRGRPSANTENFRRTREKPLVPRVRFLMKKLKNWWVKIFRISGVWHVGWWTSITSVRLIQPGNNRNDRFRYVLGVRVC